MSLHTCTIRYIHHCKRIKKRENQRQQYVTFITANELQNVKINVKK